MKTLFRSWVREKAAELGADGCTGVPEFYRDCCLLHDIAYRTGRNPAALYLGREEFITRSEADQLFRDCMQQRSKLGKFNPMSWWRWAGVRLFASKAWRGIK
jgi:hypothetical protein